MIIVRNQKLIKRNRQIGSFSGVLAIIVLGLGMYASFKYQDQISYSLIALVLGLLLSQIGMYYANRFGRTPRPDQELDAALKGLDDQYALYHYQSPVDHLLIGPAGVWMLLPFPNKGKVIYNESKKRWEKLGGNLYLRFFAQDNIGKPEREIEKGMRSLRKELKIVPELEIPEIKAALVFTEENAEVEADNAPYPTVHALQLKKLIRKEAKGSGSLPLPTVKTLQDHFGLESN
ncbi:MAG: hypothetical protein P8Y34_02255 [Anaerolineales bacterium]|jgi:hypothetical protein